jgi:hypothetical protein
MSLHDEVADISFRGQFKKNSPTPQIFIYHESTKQAKSRLESFKARRLGGQE